MSEAPARASSPAREPAAGSARARGGELGAGPARARGGEPQAGAWSVREAEPADVAEVAVAVAALLEELGGTPPPVEAMREAARTLIEDPHAGALLLAEADGALVGLLAASWQTAIHAPGRYGLIQDLWVRESWRGASIGGALLARLGGLARELGISRLEVGLPRAGFPGLPATERFYRAHGFTLLGQRMRLVLG